MEKKSLSGKWYYDIWVDGKYLDLWSVNHTLAGGVIAGPLYNLSIRFSYSFLIALVLIIGWEVYEAVRDIEETWQNRVTDTIVAIIGFGILWMFYPKWSPNIQLIVYLPLLIIWVALEIWGYMAYKGRARST